MRSNARSIARRTSHGPGRKPPSQVIALPRSETTSGSPPQRIRPAAASRRYGASNCRPCVLWPIKSASTKTSAQRCACSGVRPAFDSSDSANAFSAAASKHSHVAGSGIRLILAPRENWLDDVGGFPPESVNCLMNGNREAGTYNRRRQSMKKIVAAVVTACLAAFAGHALAQEKLTVWWGKGFYKSEDDALFDAIRKFEQKTGVKVDLS